MFYSTVFKILLIKNCFFFTFLCENCIRWKSIKTVKACLNVGLISKRVPKVRDKLEHVPVT